MKKILLTALISFPVFAYQLEKVSVETGYQTETGIKVITSPFDIITGQEIDEKHPLDFKEIVQNKAGFSYVSNGGFGQTVSIYLWGMDPKRTLTLIDGIRINDFTTPNISASYEHLLLDDVKQIEIIKGAQSGVWGADASAGVINIITREPEEGLHFKIKGLLGDYNTKKGGLTLSFRNDRGYILLGLSSFKTSGFSAVEPTKDSPLYGKRWDELGFERDPYKNTTVNIKTKWFITEKDTFEGIFKSIDAVVHYDSVDFKTGKPVDAPDGPFTVNHVDQKFYKLSYSKRYSSNIFSAYTTNSKFKRSQFGGYEGEYREYTVKNRVNHTYGFSVFGISRQDFIHQKSAGSELGKRYHNYGYYFTNVISTQNKNLILSQSIRHDSYSSFKDKTTWKLGVKGHLKNFFVSGNWGTAYNVPTPDQLFNPYWGNSDLSPENAVEWDITAGYKKFSITYFENHVKNLIDYNFTTYRYENIEGKSKIKGIEAKYTFSLEDKHLFINLNYTHLDAKKPDGSKLPRRPQNQVGFDVIWYPDERVNIGCSGVYVGKRKDTDKTQTGYYTVINTFANMEINRNLTVYLKINNITDKYYQTVNGYATEGRSVYAGLNLVF
jgi:vitamin B12 transporter